VVKIRILRHKILGLMFTAMGLVIRDHGLGCNNIISKFRVKVMRLVANFKVSNHNYTFNVLGLEVGSSEIKVQTLQPLTIYLNPNPNTQIP
jgi:hypothetical protein